MRAHKVRTWSVPSPPYLWIEGAQGPDDSEREAAQDAPRRDRISAGKDVLDQSLVVLEGHTASVRMFFIFRGPGDSLLDTFKVIGSANHETLCLE